VRQPVLLPHVLMLTGDVAANEHAHLGSPRVCDDQRGKVVVHGVKSSHT
jgi:hypothetical protein